jgi:hypothetical protein
VDVAIITQLLAPILQKREADGTAIFDLFGTSQKRKAGTPDEIIVFCVDCSNSMKQSSGLEEINVEESSQGSPTEELLAVRDTEISPTLDEMKGRAQTRFKQS